MASKPETTFYQSIHKLLNSQRVYREKMYNPLRGGTPDVWYSGNADDLWVEYKYMRALPKRVPVRMYKELSALQLRWLGNRYEEGRNVVVILGSPEGCWVFERREDWEKDLDPNFIRAERLNKHDIAEYITGRVTLC